MTANSHVVVVPIRLVQPWAEVLVPSLSAVTFCKTCNICPDTCELSPTRLWQGVRVRGIHAGGRSQRLRGDGACVRSGSVCFRGVDGSGFFLEGPKWMTRQGEWDSGVVHCGRKRISWRIQTEGVHSWTKV